VKDWGVSEFGAVVSSNTPERVRWSKRAAVTTAVVLVGVLIALWAVVKQSVPNRSSTIVASWIPNGYDRGIVFDRLEGEVSVAPRRIALFSDRLSSWKISVLVSSPDEQRTCHVLIGWTSKPLEQMPPITVSNGQKSLVLEKYSSEQKGSRSNRSQTCYSGSYPVGNRIVNIVSIVPPERVREVLRTLTIDQDGIILDAPLPTHWIRFGAQPNNVTALVTYSPGKSVRKSKPDSFVSVASISKGDPVTYGDKRQIVNNHQIWQMEPIAPPNAVAQRTALVDVNTNLAVLTANANESTFLRIAGSLRMGSNTDIDSSTRRPLYGIDGVGPWVGDLVERGLLPNGKTWRVVRGHFDPQQRIVGIADQTGANTLDSFPGTTSQVWIRTNARSTIIAVPRARLPLTVTIGGGAKKIVVPFVPSTSTDHQYAFLPNIELSQRDRFSIELSNGKDVAPEEIVWEPPERHLWPNG
jgi:hypothetical protein